MNGILPLWKEKGMTSHDCVFKLRKILGTKKVGHTGTLDPSVEGVLPICIGQATKVAEYVTNTGKEYEAVISIGTSTETEDADGAVVLNDDTHKIITRIEVEAVLEKLTGNIVQIPPMYSAVKVNGRKLYEYARKGLEVERPERIVSIKNLELLDSNELYEGTEITFQYALHVEKELISVHLPFKLGSCLGIRLIWHHSFEQLRNVYRQEDCRTLDEVAEIKSEGRIDTMIRPLEDALIDFPFIEIERRYVC